MNEKIKRKSQQRNSNYKKEANENFKTEKFNVLNKN